MLEYEINAPAGSSSASQVVILLHGRGSNRHDLFALHQHLPDDWIVIAPEAPFPAAPWGYGSGSAWYRFLGRNRPEPYTFAESLAVLEEFIGNLPSVLGGAPAKLALGGFSQGGTVSLGYALSHPGTIPRVINFSGFLADHPQVVAKPETVRGTRFFWGHGRMDGNIPFDLALEGRAQLRAARADLTDHDYAIGHWIDPAEIADAVSWTNRSRE